MGVVVLGVALSVLCAVVLPPVLVRAARLICRNAARFCFWICSPSAVPVLRAAAVAALLLIALMLVVIACVLAF
jgi:hypothetical protein